MNPYTLITGASSGIGKELATIAATKGHAVVLVARDKAALEAHATQLEKTYSVGTVAIVQDLTEPGSAQKIFDQLDRKDIVIDTLINNAGFGDYDLFHASDGPRQLAMIDLNVRALTQLTHLFLPGMVARKHGYVMNLGSVAGFLPGPLMSVYFATKAYVLSFSEALTEELRGTGVSVTCLCPSSTKTNFGQDAGVSQTHSTRTSHITPRQVAEFGWRAMESRKAVAVHGTSSRAFLFLIKFFPRFAIRRIVHRIQR